MTVEDTPLNDARSIALALALAACAGASGHFVPAQAVSSAAPNAGHSFLTIHIPRRPKGKRLHFVSPSIESASIAVAPLAGCSGCSPAITLHVGLTSTSPGCAPAAGGATCSIVLALQPGHYSGAMTAYDGPVIAGAPSGQILSTNQAFPIAVVTGQANAAAVTLYGVPVWISFTSLGMPLFVTAGNVDQIAEMLGAGSHGSMTVNALDANQNVILGPGAPVVQSALASGGGFVAKATADTIAITAGPAVMSGDWGLTTTFAGPGCAEPNAQCVYQTQLAFQPILAVTDHGSNSILIEIADSTIANPLLGTISTGISDPRDVKFDRAGNLYVVNDAGPGDVREFKPPYTGAPSVVYTTGVDGPAAISLAQNGDVAVANAGVATTLIFRPSTTVPITIPIPALAIAFDELEQSLARDAIARDRAVYGGFRIHDERYHDHRSRRRARLDIGRRKYVALRGRRWCLDGLSLRSALHHAERDAPRVRRCRRRG